MIQGILVFLIFVCIICFGIGYIRSKLYPNGVTPSENTSNVIEYTEPPEITIDEVKSASYTLVFSSGDYQVYKNKKRNFYYALNTLDNTLYFARNGGVDGNPSDLYLLMIKDSEEIFGVFTLDNKTIVTGYEDYSCKMHTDIQTYSCSKDVTIVRTSEYYGLMSLKTGTLLLDPVYSKISMIDNGNFIVEQEGYSYLFSSNAEQLITESFNYIGYNKDFGYITILNDNIDLYDTSLAKQDLSELETKYNSASQNNGFVSLSSTHSYDYSGGSKLIKTNINEEYSAEGVNFKYTGSKYTGEHYVIFDQYSACYQTPKIYVIDDNKANLLSSKEVSVNVSNLGCF